MSSPKRRKSRLTIKDKVDIIRGLEKGETGASLAKMYNVHAATICDIKRKKSQILKVAAMLEDGTVSVRGKISKKSRKTLLDDAVYAWFTEMKSQGKTVSGRSLCQKALELNKKMGGPANFKASSAWLRNFKYCHNIRFTGIYKEAFSNEPPTAVNFREYILKIVEEEGFCMDDIYNADEARVGLKSVLRESFAIHLGVQNVTQTMDETVTAMVCANASAQHSLPLYVVTKLAAAHRFKSETAIPIKYKVQKNAWMDYSTFLDWFSHHFVPQVSAYRAQNNMTGKVLLLVDNAASHSPLSEVNKINSNFIVRFLPSVIDQPSRQGIIDTMEAVYVNNLTTLMSSREADFLKYFNDLTVRDCCSILAMSWNEMPNGNIKKSWQRFWKALDEAVENEQNPKKNESSTSDNPEPDWQEDWQEEWLEEEEEEEEEPEDTRTKKEFKYVRTGNVPSPAEALIAFQTAIRWCEDQPDCNPEEITFLEWMKDRVEKKMESSI